MKIAIIGTNFISDNFVNACRELKIDIDTVYSRKIETGKTFANKYNIVNVTDSFDDLCKNSNIDTVYIASPNYAHYIQAKSLLLHNKNVIVEKPITSNSKELLELINIAKEKKLVLFEAMRPIHDPQLSTIKRLLVNIGNIQECKIQYCQYSSRYEKFKAGININAFNPELSNASLMDIGVYVIAVAHYLFGKENSSIIKSSFLNNGFESNGKGIFSYDKFDVNIEYSKIHDDLSYSYIKGNKGAIYFDKINALNNVYYINYEKNMTLHYISNVKNNMIFELNEFKALLDNNTYDHPFLKDSIEEMNTLDTIRSNNNIVFPADKV